MIKGSAPTMHVVYDYQTNRQTREAADSNGNLGSGYLYDIENRLPRPGASSTVQYGYDAGNKRVWRGDTGVDEIVFWAGSQKLITYNVTRSGSTITGIASSSTNVYFGRRLLYKGAPNYPTSSLLTGVKQDRLGSMNGKFYPYGQERPSATTNDREKFTGYFRDASTGLDYADQRYHRSGVGRFMTPDPYGGVRSREIRGVGIGMRMWGEILRTERTLAGYNNSLRLTTHLLGYVTQIFRTTDATMIRRTDMCVISISCCQRQSSIMDALIVNLMISISADQSTAFRFKAVAEVAEETRRLPLRNPLVKVAW